MITEVDTAHKIIETVRDLILKYGIRSISMDDISRSLGMSKKTLYQYIPNKKDLVFKCINSYIQEEVAALEEITTSSSDAIEEIFAIASRVLMMLREMQPTLLYDLQKYHPDSWKMVERMHSEQIAKCIKQNIVKGQNQGLYRSKINADIVSKLYVGKSLAIADEDLFPLSQFERKQLFQEHITYHLYGIVSPKGYERVKNIKNII